MGDVSRGWHKLLQIRPLIRPFIWSNINNGKSTSVCFDRWDTLCRIRVIFIVLDITKSFLQLSNLVSDVIHYGSWRWPPDWLPRFPYLSTLQVPILVEDREDVLLWRNAKP